ncbi:hypothetical protein [Vulcanisaeta distributa]|uniref:hypothetical protein n=1 Tax=Vulcanisaeta distributa TaxID=164451 RepID=UPI0006D25F9B|nr:hypothetical protein [Vulcanisaeta distributa]
MNITEPRAPPTREVCYPGTASAVLWFFAGNAMIRMPNSVGNSTKCQYTTSPSNLYRAVNVESEENAIKALINKINEEISIGKDITGLGKNLSLLLPNPSPIGYSQEEITMTCVNYLNSTVQVTGSVTVIGNINNPWFGLDPIGLSPSTSWVINSVVVGSSQLMSLWGSFNALLVGVGYFVPRWLAESVAVFGLLDAGFWLVGFPTMLSPAWALLSNVIYDLSLILYLRIAGVGRVLGRLFRRARSSTASKIRTARENIASSS